MEALEAGDGETVTVPRKSTSTVGRTDLRRWCRSRAADSWVAAPGSSVGLGRGCLCAQHRDLLKGGLGQGKLSYQARVFWGAVTRIGAGLRFSPLSAAVAARVRYHGCLPAQGPPAAPQVPPDQPPCRAAGPVARQRHGAGPGGARRGAADRGGLSGRARRRGGDRVAAHGDVEPAVLGEMTPPGGAG